MHHSIAIIVSPTGTQGCHVTTVTYLFTVEIIPVVDALIKPV